MLERPLVSSVKSHSTYSLDNHLESVEVGSEDKHAGVKTVRPPSIRSGRELFSLKQLVRILENEGICIQEHALGVVSQGPALDLKES